MMAIESSALGLPSNLRVVVSEEQIAKRVADIGRQISDDYRGRTPLVLPVLENAAVFAADLVRHIEAPLAVVHIKPQVTEQKTGPNVTTQIMFTPEHEVRGEDVLVVEGLLESGITTDFLIRHLYSRGAASVTLAAFLDRQTSRRISLQPDYFGFLIDEMYVVGYGLGAPHLGRNLPYVAATANKAAALKNP